MKSEWEPTGDYELDFFKDEKYKKLVPLTEKNKNFIEGCLKLDSNYKSNLASLIEKLKSEYSKETVFDVIREINRVNSTRLSEDEMKVLSNRLICEGYNNLNKLKKALNGTQKEIEKIFKIIVKQTEFQNSKNGKIKRRRNVSFASKFIFYISKELNCEAHNKYSKYDSKVAECLSAYADVYDVPGYQKKDFKKDSFVDEEKLWEMYRDKYNKCLSELIEVVKKEHGFNINREEIDHVIWYTQK